MRAINNIPKSGPMTPREVRSMLHLCSNYKQNPEPGKAYKSLALLLERAEEHPLTVFDPTYRELSSVQRIDGPLGIRAKYTITRNRRMAITFGWHQYLENEIAELLEEID